MGIVQMLKWFASSKTQYIKKNTNNDVVSSLHGTLKVATWTTFNAPGEYKTIYEIFNLQHRNTNAILQIVLGAMFPWVWVCFSSNKSPEQSV